MPKDLKEVVLELGAYMLKLAGIGDNLEENKLHMLENINNGKALEKFNSKVILIYTHEKIEDVLSKLKEVEGILLTGGDEVGRLDFFLIEYALKNLYKD